MMSEQRASDPNGLPCSPDEPSGSDDDARFTAVLPPELSDRYWQPGIYLRTSGTKVVIESYDSVTRRARLRIIKKC